MTYQELLTVALSRRGKNATGQIGIEASSTTALHALNESRRVAALELFLPEYERRATVAVLTTAYSYSLPTIDLDGEAITIVDVRSARLLASGDTYDKELTQLSIEQAREYPTPNSSITKRPCHYYLDSDRLYFLFYPDQAYTLNLWVSTIPADLSTGDLSSEVPPRIATMLGLHVTYLLFLWQQQMDDALTWYGMYAHELHRVQARISRRAHQIMDARVHYLPGYASADPVNDPFVRSWNS